MNNFAKFFFLFVSSIKLSSSLCPVGSIEGPGLNSNGYNCYRIFGQSTTWALAENNCVNFNGHLASVSSGFLNTFLVGQAENVLYSNSVDFWLGGSTLLVTNQWTWSDNSSFAYTYWGRGQPLGTDGTFCLSVQMASGQWYSNPCSMEKPYICEVLELSTTSCPTCQTCTTPPIPTCPTPAPWKPTCPNGFTYYSGTQMCYQILRQMTFNSASTFCQELAPGASLASIHSSDQNTFLANLASTMIAGDGPYFGWIGMHNQGQNKWQWLDGSNVDYTNWAQDEPVDISGYDCGAFYTDAVNEQLTFGYWASQPCNIALRTAICQVPATKY